MRFFDLIPYDLITNFLYQKRIQLVNSEIFRSWNFGVCFGGFNEKLGDPHAKNCKN